LADLVAFGVAPGLLVYLMALRSLGRLGWLAAFVFVACGALRLARFNVQVDTASKKYFRGAAHSRRRRHARRDRDVHRGLDHPPPLLGAVMVLLGLTFALGGLMISTTPFNSFKDFEVVKEKPSHVLFFVIVFVSVIAIKPGTMLFVLLTIYMISGPVRWVVWQVSGKGAPSPEAQALAEAAALEEGTPHKTESEPQVQDPEPSDRKV